MKKGFFAVFIGILLTAGAEASMISFYVIETGLPPTAGRVRHSQTWEDAFMEVFFDSGYIVSNYPMLRLDRKPSVGILEAAGFDIFEARDAGIDYILIAQLDYSSALQAPDGISFYIFTTSQHEIIYERHFAGKAYRSTRDEFDDLKNIIRELVGFVTNL